MKFFFSFNFKTRADLTAPRWRLTYCEGFEITPVPVLPGPAAAKRCRISGGIQVHCADTAVRVGDGELPGPARGPARAPARGPTPDTEPVSGPPARARGPARARPGARAVGPGLCRHCGAQCQSEARGIQLVSMRDPRCPQAGTVPVNRRGGVTVQVERPPAPGPAVGFGDTISGPGQAKPASHSERGRWSPGRVRVCPRLYPGGPE
jgi:hypothetical protein